MQIRELRLLLRDDPILKAFAMIEFEDGTVVRGVKLIEGPKGRRVVMRFRKSDSASAAELNAATRAAVLEAFAGWLRGEDL